MPKVRTLCLALILTLLCSSPLWADARQDFREGLQAARLGDNRRCVRLFVKAIESTQLSDRLTASAYSNLGICYRRLGKLDWAIRSYNYAISLRPDYAKAYNNRGVAYISKKMCDKAIVDFNKAISLDPRNPHSFLNRGVCWRRKGLYDRAIADYSQALGLQPGMLKAHFNRGIAYAYKGDWAGAERDAQFLKSRDPAQAARLEGLIRRLRRK